MLPHVQVLMHLSKKGWEIVKKGATTHKFCFWRSVQKDNAGANKYYSVPAVLSLCLLFCIFQAFRNALNPGCKN